ncbi:MAG: ribosomal RNA small subunit methyltransferase I [Candidatus Binatia bacterium]|nr:MAG: ribosomal RNA small subunit methyltransferase I [Candidatus Binatia bacterium]
MPGKLYVVATPIGNLEDLSPRAARVLAEVSLVAAEDTRRTRKLFARYGIRTPMVSCHENNEAERAREIVARLREGRDVALVSDAGTPGIADPGARVVRAAAEAGAEIVPVPGPSAVAAALSVSGFRCDRFVFEGFLPAGRTARRERLLELREEPRTLVFFEAPHRAEAFFGDLARIFGGERKAVVLREGTKLHETVLRGTLGELAARASELARGELTVVVEGYEERAGQRGGFTTEIDAEIDRLLSEGKKTREIAEEVAARFGLSRRSVYRRVLARSSSVAG